MNYIATRTELRQSQLVGLIESLCQALEPTQTQDDLARGRYNAVGHWLAQSSDPLLVSIVINLQGSVALGTVVKPIGLNEHDVDLVAHVSDLDATVSPAALKARIGTRLRANGTYAPLLEEKARCWRLNYAGEFHMDITPSIPNPQCPFGGELVPDKALKSWKPSNPQGYRAKFERRAALKPRIRLLQRKAFDGARLDSSVEPYPDRPRFKGILRRIVQIAKRHRDIFFIDQDPSLAPLSIIITTLASRAYEFCASRFEYEDELEFVYDVFRRMPEMLQAETIGGKTVWYLWNQTTAGENFAEKWNQEPARARAFFEWHAKATADLEKLALIEGLDAVNRQLGGMFGDAPAAKAIDAMTDHVGSARVNNRLFAAPAAGLVTTPATAATAVRPNTFFGSHS